MDAVLHSMEVRKLIGYLPENNPLYLDMYVREYLEFVANIYNLKNKKQKIADIIAQTGLTLEAHKKIGALSKGYRQRVGLAQALIHDPKVLILDEPTSGLDPNQIVEIRNLISSVGKEKTIMLSTHIMQEVEAICDKIIILNKGQIVANDIAQNIHNQAESQTKVILVEFNTDPTSEELLNISGITKAVKIKAMHWALEASTPDDVRQHIFNFAVNKGLAVLSMQKKEKSLEEVFHELTKS
jgi:ABC-2 type transport system ATP-binding protein